MAAEGHGALDVLTSAPPPGPTTGRSASRGQAAQQQQRRLLGLLLSSGEGGVARHGSLSRPEWSTATATSQSATLSHLLIAQAAAEVAEPVGRGGGSCCSVLLVGATPATLQVAVALRDAGVAVQLLDKRLAPLAAGRGEHGLGASTTTWVAHNTSMHQGRR